MQPIAEHCWLKTGSDRPFLFSLVFYLFTLLCNYQLKTRKIRCVYNLATYLGYKRIATNAGARHSPLCSWWLGAWWRSRRQSGVVEEAVPSCCNRRCSRCCYCYYCYYCGCYNSWCWKWRNAPLHWSPPSLLLPKKKTNKTKTQFGVWKLEKTNKNQFIWFRVEI